VIEGLQDMELFLQGIGCIVGNGVGWMGGA
jgi:hypothetical protein